jgi:copper chaperone CopZ
MKHLVTPTECNVSGFSYIHVLEGRIRVKIPNLKGTTLGHAREVEKVLCDAKGVHKVKTNHRTGSVLIFFDAKVISQRRVLEKVKKAGNVENLEDAAISKASRPTRNHLANFMVQKLTEVALERLILALI